MSKIYSLKEQLCFIAVLTIFIFATSVTFQAQNNAIKCCSYWAGTKLLGSKEYAATTVFRSQRCDIYDDHVLKYVISVIGENPGGNFGLQCKDTREEVERIITPPASSGYRLIKQWNIPDDPAFGGGGGSGGSTKSYSNGNSSPRTNSESSQNSSDTDDSERANERTRLFNQQNGRTSGVNPNGTQNTEIVRKDGESDEDFRARQRTALYNAQKNSKIAPDGTVDSAAWTETDGKKYTQGKKGHWIVASFKATAWCAGKMFMATGYVDACVVDEKGSGSFKGTFLQIKNSSDKYPVYYGLSGVFNKKLEPHESFTEDLVMYMPINPNKKAQMPDTVVEILIKYWVEDK